MNRIEKLEKFCHKVGILTFKKKPVIKTTKKTAVNQQASFGPYGHMLLEQIRSEWTRMFTLKYANNFTMNGVDILANTEASKNITTATDQLDLDFIVHSLNSNFNLKRLPLGLVNVVEKEPPAKSSYLLFKHMNKITKLNYVYLNDRASTIDTLTHWQIERRRWWSRHLQCSFNLALRNMEVDKHYKHSLESNLVYDLSEGKEKISSLLERITYHKNVGACENTFLAEMFKRFDAPSTTSIKHSKEVLMAETSCERILENLLLDAVNEPNDEYREKLKKFNVDLPRCTAAGTWFGLDFRLAPFKAAVLYDNSKLEVDKNSTTEADRALALNLERLAHDLKRMCYLSNVNVFVMGIDSSDEETLTQSYAKLDEMGVPFGIYLPPSVVKDGVVRVRNRDTDVTERMQLSLVAKSFKSFSDSLNF
jgi:glycyl-tRNA synthetase (class II)